MQENIRAHGMAMRSPEKRNDEGRTRTLYQNEFYSGSMISLNPSNRSENETYTKITFKRSPDYTTFNIQHSLNSCKIAVPEKELEGNEVHIVSDYPFLALYVGDNEFYPFDSNEITISEEMLPLRKSVEKATRSPLRQTLNQEPIPGENTDPRKNSNISVAAQTSELIPGPSCNSKHHKKSAECNLQDNYYSLLQNNSTSYSQHAINEMAYELADEHKCVTNTNGFGIGDKLSPAPKTHVPTSKTDLEINKNETSYGTLVEVNPSREMYIEKWNSHTNIAKQKKVHSSSRKQSENEESPYRYSRSPQNMFDQVNESIRSIENTMFFPNKHQRLSNKYENQKLLNSTLEYPRGITNLTNSSFSPYDVNKPSVHHGFSTYTDESYRVRCHNKHDDPTYSDGSNRVRCHNKYDDPTYSDESNRALYHNKYDDSTHPDESNIVCYHKKFDEPTYCDESHKVRCHNSHDEVHQHKHHRPSPDDRINNGHENDGTKETFSLRPRYVNKDNVRPFLRAKVEFAFQDQETQSETKPQRSENELPRKYSDSESPDKDLPKMTSPRLSPMAHINIQKVMNDMPTQTDNLSEKSVEKKKARSPVSTVDTSTSTSSGTNINRTQHLTIPETSKADAEPTIKGLQHMNNVLLRIQNELRPIQTDMKQLQTKLLQGTSKPKQATMNTQQKVNTKSSPEIVYTPKKGKDDCHPLHGISDPVLKAKSKFPSGSELLEELSKQILARTHDTRGRIIHSERNLKEPHASKNPHNYPT